MGGAVAAARRHGLGHEVLGVEEVRRRWPQFVVPGEWAGFYEPESGFLVPERVIGTYAEMAMRHGAEIHGQEGVDWLAEGRGGVCGDDGAGEVYGGEADFLWRGVEW